MRPAVVGSGIESASRIPHHWSCDSSSMEFGELPQLGGGWANLRSTELDTSDFRPVVISWLRLE